MIRGRRWRNIRRIVLERDNYQCQKCGSYGRLECDHIKPLFAGGAPYDLDNLQCLCRDCHIRKTRAENRARRIIQGAPRSAQAEEWHNFARSAEVDYTNGV